MSGVPENFTNGPSSPSAYDAFAITPSDTVDEAEPFRALYVGVAGNIKVRTLRNNDVVFSNVGAGILAVAGKRVFVTGTAATGLIGLV